MHDGCPKYLGVKLVKLLYTSFPGYDRIREELPISNTILEALTPRKPTVEGGERDVERYVWLIYAQDQY